MTDVHIFNYKDWNKALQMSIPIRIHLYQNIFYNDGESRVSTITGILPYDVYFLSNAKKALHVGSYKLILNNEDTKLTREYRAEYPWFSKHIEYETSNNRNIYMHIGNYWFNSDACELCGDGKIKTEDNYRVDKHHTVNIMVTKSAITYEDLYKTLVPVLANPDVEVYVHINTISE